MSPDFFLVPTGWAITGAAIFGLVIGSFLNVVIHRLPLMLERQWQADAAELTGQPSVTVERLNLLVPRSHCPACGHRLRVTELLPVASWLMLGGRCSSCKTAVSMRYPIVEILYALLCAICVWRFGITSLALAASLYCAMLLACAFIDLETQLLPDALTLPLLWAGLLLGVAGGFVRLEDSVTGAAVGYASLWIVHHVFRLLTRREGMGYGDFKLLAALGAWLGWQALPAVILFASAGGALYGITAVVLRRRDAHTPIAFGPWLALAGALALFWRSGWPTLTP
jgi:leader peptidase (prepilin peptidase)/N-methyltransferase